ncbi:MAG TPA: hypothetical protein VGO40_17010 [Longimicrobium sp.]|nr:hypothetical protein [Longimicrobium sp.]
MTDRAPAAADRLHLVVTCTKRKRRAALGPLRLREHRHPSLSVRLASWLDALGRPCDPAAAAAVGDLYAGDHWQIARSLPGLAGSRGVQARLWVCSAGYGLVPGDASVFPYSATFSRNHADSVWRTGETPPHAESVARWWSGLAEWEGPVAGTPRSVQALAALDPGAAIWVVASETYLNAMRDDLVAAAGTLDDAGHLALVSAGSPWLQGLERNQLRFDWRLQGPRGPLGGAAMSLNVRVAELLLEGAWEPAAAVLNERLRGYAGSIATRERKMGAKVSPAEVAAFIREELEVRPAASKTALLRKLRDERRWAFEEKRFGRLFMQVRDVISPAAAHTVPQEKRNRKCLR